MRRIQSSLQRRYLRHLKEFAARLGVAVVHNSLVAGVLGHVEDRRIVLRAGLTIEQQLLTLVHELAHLIIHFKASPPLNRTVCEYEAEAVERWFAAVLEIGAATDGLDPGTMTDDLLACSVVRVRYAFEVIRKAALDGGSSLPSSCLQAQAAVEVDTSAREEIILHDELHGVRDLIRLT